MRIKSLAVVAFAAGVAISVSGCDPTTAAGPASTTPAAQTPPAQPGQTTQPGQPGQTTQAGQPTQPGGSPQGGIDHDGDNAGAPVTDTTTPASGLPKCVTRQVVLDKGHGGPVAGDWFLKFINSTSVTCVIQGFPGVSQTNGPTGDPVGEPAERDQGPGAPKPTPVVLAPGAAAQFEFITYPKQVNNCDALRTNTLRVYPPDNTESMWLPWDSLICPSPQRMLVVRAVTPVS